MQQSSNPICYLWLLENLFLFSHKFSPKEVLQVYQIKQQLHNLINELLFTVSMIAANKV